jgi:hypothetical protein
MFGIYGDRGHNVSEKMLIKFDAIYFGYPQERAEGFREDMSSR